MSPKCGFILLILILIIILVIINVIIFSPSGILLNINPKSNHFPLPQSFSGVLKKNNILSKAQKFFVNEMEGPESIAILNDTIFTSSRNGYIYRIDSQGQSLTPLIKIIDSCCDKWNQTLCSRPLAMRFDGMAVLYVIEPYFGIFRIKDVLTNKPIVEPILNYSQTMTLEKSSKFFDDFVIEENVGLNGGHVLYISEMSTEFDLSQIIFAISSAESGRILRYDINAQKLDVLVDNLHCPNGMELSADKHFLLFSETASRRIRKHYIKGENRGQTTTILASLPGGQCKTEPDNIRKTKSNTYWVAIAIARCQQNPLIFDRFDDKPLLRKLFFRSLHLIGTVVQYLGHLFDLNLLKNLGFELKTGLNNFIVGKHLAHSHGLGLEISESGTILRGIHSPDGTISLLSEVNQSEEDNKTIVYLGSLYNKYLAKLYLQ